MHEEHQPRGRRLRSCAPPVAAQLHGIADELVALAKGPIERDVLALVRRIEAVAERLGGADDR